MAIKDDCVRYQVVRKALWCATILTSFWGGALPTSSPANAEEGIYAASTASIADASSVSLRDALFDELAEDAERFERQFGIVKRVVRLVRPTIVHIDALATEGGQEVIDEAGSGVILRMGEKFYVLTNRHVVDTSSLGKVRVRTEEGELLTLVKQWSDPSTDVAVIEVAESELMPAHLGNSDRVEIGDFVLAVGSPFGLSHSVSYGIVSAKGRWDLALGQKAVRFQDFLQTDAAINPGNSGGPLLNLKGEVIGINTAIASNSGGNEGIGFSIPINLAVHVATQLVQEGAISTAYLGVRLDHDFTTKMVREPSLPSSLGLRRKQGAMVKAITPDSPAADAHLLPGDVVTEFDGHQVEDDDHLINLVSLTPVNEVVSISFVRKRKPYIVQIRVGRRRDFE